jgi:D-alanyl-D-alanine carboxypeptidase
MADSLSPQMRSALDALLVDMVDDPRGPGVAILVARNGQVLYREARGLANVEHAVQLSPDHVFRIASASKMFTAAAILRLCDDGKLALDDALVKFLPEFPNAAAITVRMLLNHTSGLQAINLVPGWVGNPCRADVSMAESIASFSQLPVNFAPGAAYKYNNSGYLLLGAILEVVTGQPWHRTVADMIAPLGMRRTVYGDNTLLVERLVDGYSRKNGVVTRAPFISMTQPHAAGALLSCVDDMLLWGEALFGGRVLRPATLELMQTVVPPCDNYGLGLMTSIVRGRRAFGHSGSIHGFASLFLHLPESQLTVIALQNSDAEDLTDVLVRSAAAVALGDPFPLARVVPMPDAALAMYAGTYVLEGGDFKAEFTVAGGALLAVGKTLLPIGNGVFCVSKSVIRVEFETTSDAAQPPSSLRLFLNGDGDGSKMVRAAI